MSDDRPLGLISLDELVRILPDLIADAQREHDTRVPPPLRGSLTKATGVVVTPGSISAEVQLDEDEPGVLSQVQLANPVDAGDRVVVLLSPGGSAIAIGNGNAQARATMPAALSWAEITSAGSTGLATDTTHLVLPDGNSTIFGDDISEGTSVNLAEINADGFYAIEVAGTAIATTGGDTYHTARFDLDITDAAGRPLGLIQDLRGAGLVATKHQVDVTMSWSGFLAATSTIGLQGTFYGGGGGTWILDGGASISRLS